MNIKYFAGIPVIDVGLEEALSYIQQRFNQKEKTLLFYANSNFVVQCQHVKPLLNQEQVVVFNDGVSIDAACKLLFGHAFKANLNGTDFTPKLLALMGTSAKIGLLGAQPGVAKQAAESINTLCGANVVSVIRDGYTEMADTQKTITLLNDSSVDIVLVALGNPRQENWILQNATALNATLIIGVGALFDFMSGNVKRAPNWVRTCRLEWFYRLLHEPKRLLKRYTVDVAYFFYLCFKNKTN